MRERGKDSQPARQTDRQAGRHLYTQKKGTEKKGEGEEKKRKGEVGEES